MSKVIGREAEIELLKNALISDKAELVAVYGRRRVGKTFLIRETLAQNIVLELSGIPDVSLTDQLKNFHFELSQKAKRFTKLEAPVNWFDAFKYLEKFIVGLKTKKKKVIFIDEFPWFYTHKSKFVQMFSHFWNNFCTKRNDLVIVVCGSAASFMLKHVINSRTGLHHRITIPIRLLPFALYETELFLQSKKINLNRYELLQIYMAIGGIPHYLDKIQKGDSVPAAIDRLCFDSNGILVNEFNIVFASLFDNSENHKNIVEILATTQKGISRAQLVTKSKISSGGTLSKMLRELVESGFVTEYLPYGNKKKDTLYRLSDEYSMFYQRYIKNNPNSSWKTLYSSRSYASWSGFAFETLCQKHIKQIKKGLGLSGIDSKNSSWQNKNAQIDLLIDRSDRSINICEMKFSNQEFTITKSYADKLRLKKNEFMKNLPGRKNIFTTLITTFGVRINTHSQQVLDSQLTMNSLFEKI